MVQITKIEPQKNKSDRVNVYVDHEFFCGLQTFVCVKHGIKEGVNIEKEVLTQMLIESDYEQALNKAANLLNKMLKTQKQLVTYLKQKGYDDIIVNKVIEKLTEYGYINDENYVNMYISTYKNKFGVKKLEFELINKGINQIIIKEALKALEYDPEIIINIAKKYLKDKELDLKNMQKLTQHLAYKGFSYDQINQCINTLKQKG